MDIFLKKVMLDGLPYPEAALKDAKLSGRLSHRLGRWEENSAPVLPGAAVWLTDDAGAAKRLSKEGESVVYLLTEDNREISCAGAAWCAKVPGQGAEEGKSRERTGWQKELFAVEKTGFPDWLPESFLWRVWLRHNGLPWYIRETDRLLLREMTETDLDFVLEMQKEEGRAGWAARAYAGEKRDTAGRIREEEKEKLSAYIGQIYGFYGFGIWLVLEKESGMPVGRAGLQMREEIPGPELGFSIAPQFRRRGYAREACRAVLFWAKEELETENVYAVADRENIASCRLCEQLGFVRARTETKNAETDVLFVLEQHPDGYLR